mmetsp:Transcript_40859/g.80514  ORF Transcript_40859/g.80514 Transcript_40859/m.80514 type:complete len:92 (-) Transcript_40859:1532-1807(-)
MGNRETRDKETETEQRDELKKREHTKSKERKERGIFYTLGAMRSVRGREALSQFVLPVYLSLSFFLCFVCSNEQVEERGKQRFLLDAGEGI